MEEFSECLGFPKVTADESCSEPPPSAPPFSLPPSSPPPSMSQNSWSQVNHHLIQVPKHYGAFNLGAARLTANGPKHKVVITVVDNKVELDLMRLAIDGVTMHEAVAPWHQNGTLELNVDGRIVYFQWDLNQSPVWFCFKTKFVNDIKTMSTEEKLWGDLENCYSLVIQEENAWL